MQEQNHSFEELETRLLEKLKDQGCTSITIAGYHYLCNSIFKWFKENNMDSYSEEGGNRFLQDYQSKHGENPYHAHLKKVIHRLNDIKKGTWSSVHSDKSKHFYLPDSFVETINEYCRWNDDAGRAAGTIRIKKYAVSWFLDEVAKQKCDSLNNLSPELIVRACTKVTDRSHWGEIGRFLRYLAEQGHINTDYSTFVPHYRRPYVVPSVYSIEEIKKIEQAVDTSTVLGKRDYAMLLLASRMGLRSGDIANLKIQDIQNRAELNIIQQKTRNALHLPIIPEVQSAIEDYLSVRPSTESDLVFINTVAPYHAATTATIRASLAKYIRLAGIDSGNRKRGPHALRSSLASSMVNNEISYETVRRVLGHSSNNAIKHYARIDTEKLRRYSLEPPIPTGKFHDFLYGEVE